MNMKLSFDPMKVTRGIFFYNDIEILHLPHYFFVNSYSFSFEC